MDVDFEDASLRRLEADPGFTAGFEAALVKVFRKRMQLIRAAVDERAFYAMKSLHYEKLKGNLDGHSSMRLNDQWRLLLRLRQGEGGKTVASPRRVLLGESNHQALDRCVHRRAADGTCAPVRKPPFLGG